MQRPRSLSLASLNLRHRAVPALSGALLVACLGASCGQPGEPGADPVEPGDGLVLEPQEARIPQATRVEPATAFAGATPVLTITGRNFTPDMRVSIGNTLATPVKVLSSTQLQVTLPATVNTVGKKAVRLTTGTTLRSSERDDLFALTQDPIALASVEQTIDGVNAMLVAAGDANGDGKPDAFVLSADGETVRLYLSNGRGPLVPVPTLAVDAFTIKTMALGDA